MLEKSTSMAALRKAIAQERPTSFAARGWSSVGLRSRHDPVREEIVLRISKRSVAMTNLTFANDETKLFMD